MASKIEWNYYKKEFDELVAQTRELLSDVIVDCVGNEVPKILQQAIFARKKDHSPLTAWIISPSCLLDGADEAFVAQYEKIVQDIIPKKLFQPNSEALSECGRTVKTMIRLRLESMTLAEQKEFLRCALNDHTDMNGVFSLLQTCRDWEPPLLYDALLQTYAIPKNQYQYRVSSPAWKIANTRNQMIGHDKNYTIRNCTSEWFVTCLPNFVAIAKSLHTNEDKDELNDLKQHCARVQATASCPPLSKSELADIWAQIMPKRRFEEPLLTNSHYTLSAHYDKKVEKLYLYSQKEVAEIFGEWAKEHAVSEMALLNEMGGQQEIMQNVANDLNDMLVKLHHMMNMPGDLLPTNGTAKAVSAADAAPAANAASAANPAPAANAASTVNPAPEAKPAPEAQLPKKPAVRYKLPAFPLLQNYTNGFITEAQQREIFSQCNVLADASCWESKAGRDFIANCVVPVQKNAKCRIVADWPTRVDLYQKETSPQFDAQSHELARAAHNQMHYLHKMGALLYGPERDGGQSSQTSLMRIVEQSDSQVVCLLTADWGFCELLAKQQYPNVIPLLISAGGGCSVHRCLRELVHQNSLGHDPDAAEKPDIPKTASAPQPSQTIPSAAPLPQAKVPAPKPAAPAPKSAAPAPKPAVPTPKPAVPLANAGENLPWRDPAQIKELHTDKGEAVFLRCKLAEGGEGAIYLTDRSDMVAKLYNKHSLTARRRDKLTLMLQKDPHVAALCWPCATLYRTDDDGFAGYLMPLVGSEYEELGQKVLNLDKPAVQTVLRGWDRETLAKLCVNICRAFERLNAADILMGDVNPRNIMVRVTTPENPEVRIVDCDSFQISEYPCPAGREEFISPQIYEKYGRNVKFSDILRTKDDEQYALAVLLFMVLVLKQHPFDGKGEKDRVAAMCAHAFPYHYKEKNSSEADVSGADAPDSHAPMIWNNLHPDVRELFYQTFKKGVTAAPGRWVTALQHYASEIRAGRCRRELLPTLYYDPDGTWTVEFTCDMCHQKANMPKERWERLHSGKNKRLCMCNACRSIMFRLKEDPQKVSVKCSACGKPHMVDKWTATEITEYGRQIYCPHCRESVSTKCIYCGKALTLPRVRLTRGNNRAVCDRCREQAETVCSKCGKQMTISRGRMEENERTNKEPICSECWEKLPAVCDRCGRSMEAPRWKLRDLKERGKNPLCQDCLAEISRRRN